MSSTSTPAENSTSMGNIAGENDNGHIWTADRPTTTNGLDGHRGHSYINTRNRTSSSRPHSHSLPSSRLQSPSRYQGFNNSVARHRGMSVSTRLAVLQLQFLVVGGGISGLACAYALAASGHKVRVVEKAPSLGQKAGGIRLPPNLTKILIEWGLEKELYDKTEPCRGSSFRDLETGERVGWLEWKEDVIKETGGEFLLIHHNDLHQMLYDLAISVGVRVSFDTAITSIGVDGKSARSSPLAKLSTGETVRPDVIIGADGRTSVVRGIISQAAGSYEEEGVDLGMSVWTLTIPTEMLKNDPELLGLTQSPERGNKEYNLHIFWPDREVDLDEPEEESWDDLCSTSSLRLDGCDPMLQRLLRLTPQGLRTKIVRKGSVDEWVDDSQRIVLVGESAHPLLPCSNHGCSMAVEDAAVIGALFSRLRSWDQIPALLEAFQDIRQGRCEAVNFQEFSNMQLVQLPPGPQRQHRDQAMRENLNHGREHWDEGRLRQQWEEISEIFGYNAREAAEDWWVQWGLLRERAKMGPMVLHDSLDLNVSVHVAAEA
ncbi:hypothetical protein JAAARDRAFT_55091 [Jaapia argillacea MUCL 33604]|uniref:FAD-binding domain-containing protein n=1 Tax=Jaapia argillacea MUCL 33604 TaxID=933084 RepID=A0A067QGM0_9AGAM|nr:hypothetical protein JAAARDRAFT_55091 [Jaapia argillacea MUCL 33604]